jgi:putative transposase
LGKHELIKAAARGNHRARNRHPSTLERERRTEAFTPQRARKPRYRASGLFRQRFALKRHWLRAMRFHK